MLIPEHLIDLSMVDKINVMGKGGKEKIISCILPKWKRVNRRLHDFEIDHDGVRLCLEVKKQTDLQWFDSGKYYNIEPRNRNIKMLFINHDRGFISSIIVTSLCQFIDYLCANRQDDGWTKEVMEKAAYFKEKFPSLQFKAKVSIAKVFKENPQLFEIIYQRK